MRLKSMKFLIAVLTLTLLSGCSKDPKGVPSPSTSDAEAEPSKIEISPAVITQPDPAVIAEAEAAQNAPPAPEVPKADESKFPQDLQKCAAFLPGELEKLSKDEAQTCLVNNEYAEGLFGLSVNISVYCNLEEKASCFVHEFGLRRTAELHLISKYVLESRFAVAGFQAECDELPATSESGFQITGQAKCTFTRAASQPAVVN